MRALKRNTWGIAVATVAVLGLLVSGLASAAPVSAAGNAGAVATAGTAAGANAGLPTPIKHVFLIVMENEETAVIYGKQPYETSVANSYAWGGDANSNPQGVGYYAACHPSAPNYLALTSGRDMQCGSDGYNTFKANNLGNLLQTANESWVAYEESASVPCQLNNSSLYVVRHNPFTYYSDLGGNTTGSVCETHDVPIANLTNDYPYAQTPPAFTYIAPNVLDDGHSSSATYGDSWLSTFVPKLMNQSWFASSVIFIVYDEAYQANGAYNSTGYDGLHGGPVYMAAISPFTRGVGALDVNSSHYNLLSTIEWLLDLPPTGTGADGTAAFPALTGLFQPRLFGPAKDLAYGDLAFTDLAGYDLRGDDLQFANLSGIDLQGADLRGADLEYADLAGANLQGADLQGAALPYADLAGASLQGADLSGAGLQFADLTGATLTGLSSSHETNFDGASLNHADLLNAVCGSPNYILASGANTNALSVPAACQPPL